MENSTDTSVSVNSFLHALRPGIRTLMPWVVVACLVSLTAELALTLSPSQISALHYLDLFFLCFFATDLGFSGKFATNSKQFFKENWLNILALIPVVRALRFIRFSGLTRLGRVAKLARFQKAGKLLKAAPKVEKTVKRVRKGRRRFLGEKGE